jgi:hypothetical protein
MFGLNFGLTRMAETEPKARLPSMEIPAILPVFRME